jgi:hypothetical protein
VLVDQFMGYLSALFSGVLCLISLCFSGVHLFRLLVYCVFQHSSSYKLPSFQFCLSSYCVFQFYSQVHTGCLHFSLMLSFSSSYSLIHRRRSLLFCVGALSDCYIYLLIAMMVCQKTTKKCSCLMLLHGKLLHKPGA